jgi:asparagine synthase (glutamine-hydrolysing)
MCGIAGILRFDGQPVMRAEVEAMTDAIAHRGRDSVGFAIGGVGDLSDSVVGLGHRRLSVIDLSPQAAQPMHSPDRQTCIVYNGELYNYLQLRNDLKHHGVQFRTESDTEVVLAAYDVWGRECLSRFDGMFALAIWDGRRRVLFCARDAIGIKPFYYRLDGTTFRFCSESRALAGRALDGLAVAAYFFSMYVPRELSIFAGVSKLLPGHWMEVSPDGDCAKQQWWDLPDTASVAVSPDEAAERLRDTLDRAVELQLQSDVPVGAFLSGGFDSGMLVAAAARKQAKFHTYSIGFDDARQFNELPIAAALASRYQTQHHSYTLRSDDVLGILDKALSVMSEPVADSAVVPTWFLAGRAAEDGVKVLLSGTGGDEVFCGYPRYVASTWRRRILYQLPGSIRSLIGNAFLGGSVLGARLAHASVDMAVYAGGSADLAAMYLGEPQQIAEFVERLATRVFPPPQARMPALYRHMAFDLQVYLPDLLLLLLDQLTMAHTIEGRVPLLSVDLIRASYALPPNLHAESRAATTRKLMRRMAAGRLDQRTFTAPKQGFSGPVRAWIADNQAAFRERTLAISDIPGLEQMSAERWWKVSPGARDVKWAHEIFLLYSFATWYHANVHG